MDYFVTIASDYSQQWQAELLLESFKYHQASHRLHVTLVNTSHTVSLGHNLQNHPRLSKIDDIGNMRGFAKLNKLYAIVDALQQGYLQQPFMVLEPTMLLYQALDIRRATYPEIIFQADETFTLELVKEKIPNLSSYLPMKQWVPLGNLTYYNNIPIECFQKAILQTEIFAYEQLKAKQSLWPDTERVAWVGNFLELLGQVAINGTTAFSMPITHHQEQPLIDYELGWSPYFSSKMFGQNSYLLGNPLEILSCLPPLSQAAKYLAFLAKRLLHYNKVLL